ncbi:MAG: M14 family zinc carboxypeptidase [Vicinamibacterales bacterium]
MRRLAAIAAVLFAGVFITHAQQSASIADLKTTPEATDYKSTSTYDDVVKFMKATAAASPDIHYGEYGTTSEGRQMPIAIVGTGLKDVTPAAVKATGKLRVHIQANVHACEVEGKEACLVLLREFALGRHADWLKSMVFLITPDFNADGNEKFGNNRGRQNGPINGEGTRANAQGLNINRDYMKLDTPEAQAFVKLWNDYDPDIGFDLHTSDGSYHGYYLTYSPPLNPDTSPTIMKIMTDEWFPFVTKQIKAKHGWDTYYYGNVATPGGRGGRGGRGRGAAEAAAGRGAGGSGAATGAVGASQPGSFRPVQGGSQGQASPGREGGAARGGGRAGGRGFGGGPACVNTTPDPAAGPREWRTFEHVPRFHNNYVGLRNRFALLSEAYSYATFEDRIKVTNYFVEEALNFANAHVAELKKAIATADRERLTGAVEATSAQMKLGGLIDVLMGEVEPITNPVTNTVMCNRKDVVHPEQMVDMRWFEPETTETVPSAYYIPANATKAIQLLKEHGIQMREAGAIRPGGLETFTIEHNEPAQQFEGHAMRKVTGAWAADATASVPAGSWEVSMSQPLARLAFYLIEPASDDGLVAWNALDDQLKDAKTYPIVRRR